MIFVVDIPLKAFFSVSAHPPNRSMFSKKLLFTTALDLKGPGAHLTVTETLLRRERERKRERETLGSEKKEEWFI